MFPSVIAFNPVSKISPQITPEHWVRFNQMIQLGHLQLQEWNADNNSRPRAISDQTVGSQSFIKVLHYELGTL